MSRRPKSRKYMFAKLEYRAMDTVRSEGKVIRQIHQLLNDLGVAYDERGLPTDALTGKAALQFVVRWDEDGKDYDAKIQKISTEQDGLANNLAAIHLWLEGRCLNIRRGVEKPGEAFGAHAIEGSNLPPSWGDHLLGFKIKAIGWNNPAPGGREGG